MANFEIWIYSSYAYAVALFQYHLTQWLENELEAATYKALNPVTMLAISYALA